MKCPICNGELELNTINNILLGYPPWNCSICDIQWYDEELIPERTICYQSVKVIGDVK